MAELKCDYCENSVCVTEDDHVLIDDMIVCLECAPLLKGYTVERNYMELVSINCPGIFKDPQFIEWLNHAADGVEINPGYRPRAATWHRSHEKVGEFSDVFMSVDITTDGYAEGSDSDMPRHCWNMIINMVRYAGIPDNTGVIVWLKNLGIGGKD